MKAKEIAFGGWNTATRELEKPYVERVETSFRTIEYPSKKDAVKFMEDNYIREESVMHKTYKVWFEPCHYNLKNKYSFIIKRKQK